MKRISGLGTKRHYQVVLHQKVLVRFEIAILTGSHLRSERNQKNGDHPDVPQVTNILMIPSTLRF